MKRQYIVILMVVFMLMAFASPVGASPSAVFVQFLGGTWTKGGVNFKFSVNENLGSSWLKGSVSWDGGNVQMTCNQEGDIVTCTAPEKVADKNIIVSFQGSQFWTYVQSRSWCYKLWDYDPDEIWKNYGPICQDFQASYGDVIEFYNPDWEYSYEYVFWHKEDWGCGTGIVGDAYYWDDCP